MYPSNYPSYSSMSNYSSSMNYDRPSSSDDRIIGGGFAFPFLLGGVTGAALAPSFWGPGRPPYQPYPPYPPYRPPYPPYRPYPYYGPYYR